MGDGVGPAAGPRSARSWRFTATPVGLSDLPSTAQLPACCAVGIPSGFDGLATVTGRRRKAPRMDHVEGPETGRGKGRAGGLIQVRARAYRGERKGRG
jgi:hypothetical protein